MDRNEGSHYDNYNLHWSLSARRAWIEITVVGVLATLVTVALRKESVDRNSRCTKDSSILISVALRKESVDRNYEYVVDTYDDMNVALRKESVDRNPNTTTYKHALNGRSPQGERG